jgi:hypothetical protein
VADNPIHTFFQYSSFSRHADVMQVFVDDIALAQLLVYLLEVFLTASLMLGFLVRFSGSFGIDNLLAKGMISWAPSQGPVARALALAS